MSNIKDCFISRFEGGHLVEIDYSQLEIIGLAVLSKDTALRNDLLDGADLHSMSAARLYGQPYLYVKSQVEKGNKMWIQNRKLAKSLSFELQYGSSAKSMSEKNGITLKLAKDFIEGYYVRYPSVKDWQEKNIAYVRNGAEPTKMTSDLGLPICKSVLPSVTGRKYVFFEKDSPEWIRKKGTLTSFNPTLIKNYPVQGLCTGDIVPAALGQINRHIIREGLENEVLMINTIHDSVLFDVDSEKFTDSRYLNILGNLCTIMVSIVDDINYLWPDLGFDIPLKVEISHGFNWGDMNPVHF